MGKKTEQLTETVKTVATIAGAVVTIAGTILTTFGGNNDKK